MLPQRSKHPREMVITPKASTSIFPTGPLSALEVVQLGKRPSVLSTLQQVTSFQPAKQRRRAAAVTWPLQYIHSLLSSRRPLPVSPRPPSGNDTSRCWARQCRRTGETPVFCTSVCVCVTRETRLSLVPLDAAVTPVRWSLLRVHVTGVTLGVSG